MSAQEKQCCGNCMFNDEGTCQKIKGPQHQSYGDSLDDDDACVLDEQLACCVDGSDYFAELRVKDDFGCVLWKSKDLS